MLQIHHKGPTVGLFTPEVGEFSPSTVLQPLQETDNTHVQWGVCCL